VQVFDKPFQTDESVGKLLDVVHSTLQRVRNGDFYSEHNLTQDQRHTSILMMRQINECLAFINTYTRQSYCELVHSRSCMHLTKPFSRETCSQRSIQKLPLYY